MASVHTHQIHVETSEELVTVQIGGEGAVPGGFAKLFNRVIDSEAWAKLSDAGRAAYLPLVRFADNRNQFRVQIGQAALMKYAGLSRSSIKRAIKDLLASRLIVLVEQGGVTPDGRNESNLYQLMVPVEPTPRKIGGRASISRSPAASAADSPSESFPVEDNPYPHAFLAPTNASEEEVVDATDEDDAGDHAIGSDPVPGRPSNPPGVRHRTPTRFSSEPRPGSMPNRLADLDRTPAPARRTQAGGFSAGPQYRRISEPQDSSRRGWSDGAPEPKLQSAKPQGAKTRGNTMSRTSVPDAAVLLLENGVDEPAARELALAYPRQRIADVVETMQYRRARGKCANPGGFIRDALVRQWQTPQAVFDARAKAQAAARAQEANARADADRRRVREQSAAEAGHVRADQQQIETLIEALDDQELNELAAEVLKKYDGNTAVLSVLTRKPPRASRLMKLEIAQLLK